MLFLKVKDNKKRFLFNSLEYKVKINKFIKINLLTQYLLKKKVDKKYIYILESLYSKHLYVNSFKTRLSSRCLYTNRRNIVNKKLKLSRSILRNMIQFGFIPGYKKAVW